MILLPLLASVLSLKAPAVLPPTPKGDFVVRGSASVGSGSEGFHNLTIHTSTPDGKGVGEEIQGAIVTPKNIKLKRGKARKFSVKFKSPASYSGKIWFCLSKAPVKNTGSSSNKNSPISLRTRSCYSRKVTSEIPNS